MKLDILPLDAPLGAEVRGVSFARPIDDDTRRALLAAIARHHVVVLRGHGDPPANAPYRDFGLRFGPLRPSVAAITIA